jgi:hypothetical protein
VHEGRNGVFLLLNHDFLITLEVVPQENDLAQVIFMIWCAVFAHKTFIQGLGGVWHVKKGRLLAAKTGFLTFGNEEMS